MVSGGGGGKVGRGVVRGRGGGRRKEEGARWEKREESEILKGYWE